MKDVGNYGNEMKVGFLKIGLGGSERTPDREDAIQVSGLGHYVSEEGALH